jgi:GDP-L-fucose synthase
MLNKNVLVTGGAGFVGRHFCKRFSDNGWNVICVDNLISESSKPIDKWPNHLKPNINFTFINKDCRDFFKNDNNIHFNLVIHLAAVVGGRATIENAPLAVGEDLSIDAEMFKWAVSSKPDKIIFFSSSAAYPIKYQKDNDIKSLLSEDMISFEEDIGMADLTYGWAKLTGEYLARLAHQKYGLNVICYRPFSGYGEDQDEVYPFPAILSRVLKKENPINIWSNTIRDFIYIEDVVDCVIKTMDIITDGTAINIGTGIATSFYDLAKLICKITNHDAEINILNDKPAGVYYRVCNTDLLTAYNFNYNTSLIDGIKLCIQFKEQKI